MNINCPKEGHQRFNTKFLCADCVEQGDFDALLCDQCLKTHPHNGRFIPLSGIEKSTVLIKDTPKQAEVQGYIKMIGEQRICDQNLHDIFDYFKERIITRLDSLKLALIKKLNIENVRHDEILSQTRIISRGAFSFKDYSAQVRLFQRKQISRDELIENIKNFELHQRPSLQQQYLKLMNEITHVCSLDREKFSDIDEIPFNQLSGSLRNLLVFKNISGKLRLEEKNIIRKLIGKPFSDFQIQYKFDLQEELGSKLHQLGKQQKQAHLHIFTMRNTRKVGAYIDMQSPELSVLFQVYEEAKFKFKPDQLAKPMNIDEINEQLVFGDGDFVVKLLDEGDQNISLRFISTLGNGYNSINEITGNNVKHLGQTEKGGLIGYEIYRIIG